MTKTILGALTMALALPLAAAAAEIHGTVSEDGKPVGKGVGLKLDCDGNVELPITNRLAISQLWPNLLTTDVFGSLPMRVPPS